MIKLLPIAFKPISAEALGELDAMERIQWWALNTPAGVVLQSADGGVLFLEGQAAIEDETVGTTLVMIEDLHKAAAHQEKVDLKKAVEVSGASVPCPMCDGCGSVTSDTGTSWSAALIEARDNDRTAMAIEDRLIHEVDCPGCSGVGKVAPSQARKLKSQMED